MNRIMIAGVSSGVGKTTISLGIMAALNKRGMNVGPFKVGPDYIDPGFHSFVTNNSSYNLDSWLLEEDTLEYLFRRNMESRDIGIIEGVMGLYDGFGTEKDMGSSAHVAKLLKTPVILIIDGKGISSSAGAMVLGYKLYDKEVDIKGVIINRVSGRVHYDILKEVIERDTGIPCVGYLPSNTDISLNSRHLGLIPFEEVKGLKKKVDEVIKMIEETIELDKIISIASDTKKIKDIANPYGALKNIGKGLRIGIARDKAFSFYYEDNFNLMKEMGIELVGFSPLKDRNIPIGLDGLYIGGGFPEVFGNELEENEEFRKNLKNHLEEGLPSYAECGGLMYLTESIKDLENREFEMVGFFPTKATMTKRLQRFGYIEIDAYDDVYIRGHEFHRSMIDNNDKLTYQYKVHKIRKGRLNKEWECGLVKKNSLAAYGHVHFYSNPQFLMKFVEKCKMFKQKLNDI